MTAFLDQLTEINGYINDLVWVKIGLFLLLGAGLLMTIVTKVFQVSHLGHWWKVTIGSLFKKNGNATKKTGSSISQFQALCTALAATVGTGNIAGVATAIVVGGTGAVFWMWVAAFLGMAAKFSEIVLGIYFRRRNPAGEWSGGAMYYLTDGVGKIRGMKIPAKILAVLFAIFTILASFGIGNMSQVDNIAKNFTNTFLKNVDLGMLWGSVSVADLIIGVAVMIITAVIVIGGLQRLATFAERVVPFMAVLYIVGSLAIIGMNFGKLDDIFVSIFSYAFNVKAVAGGTLGAFIAKVVANGCKRGVFSNEAGLGSAVMVHTSADVKEPVKQGMWGIFEVFMDTFVICTMSALVILSSSLVDLKSGTALVTAEETATMASRAFSEFIPFGEVFVAIAMFLFAFTTILGWSQYGSKAVEYLFGTKAASIYKVVFVLMVLSGAILPTSLAWDISDTFNGMMMIPNLIAVIILCPLVAKITKNYVDRKIKKKDVAPILSYDPKIQKEMEEGLNEESTL